MENYFLLLPERIQLEGTLQRREPNQVLIDGSPVDLQRSIRAYNHSTEFNWGYPGRGPAQLAFAILLTYWQQDLALDFHQEFKAVCISKLPQADFQIEINLREMLQGIARERNSRSKSDQNDYF